MLKTVQTGTGGGGNGSGTVTQVATGTGLTGGPITTSGTISLANTAVTAGVYGDGTHVSQVTIDAQGRVTNAANVVITNQGTVTNVATGVGLSGGPITTTGTIILANTAVTAGVYADSTHVPQITIDAQGRITAASNVAISAGGSGTVTNVATGTGLTGGPITTTGTVSLANTAVTSGVYGDNTHVSQITIDAQGRITAAANIVIASGGSGTVTNVATGTGLTGGPITSTGTISLANTAVTAGTYGNSLAVSQFTVDAQGRLTAASNVSIATATSSTLGVAEADGITINVSAGVFSVGTVASLANAATITPNAVTQFEVTALAANATIANPSGSPKDGQKLILRIKDNASSHTLAWGNAYRVIVGITLPTATTGNTIPRYVGCIWNSQDSLWDVVAAQ